MSTNSGTVRKSNTPHHHNQIGSTTNNKEQVNINIPQPEESRETEKILDEKEWKKHPGGA